MSDILQIAEALTALGYANDLRLANMLELIRSKQYDLGRWPLEYNYDGKTGCDLAENEGTQSVGYNCAL